MTPYFSYSLLFVLTFFSSAFIHETSAQGPTNGSCVVGLFRQTGKTNAIVWTCECPIAYGRVSVPAPPIEDDTLASFVQHVRCYDRTQRNLARVCERSPAQFHRQATAAIKKCQRTNKPTQALKRRFPGPLKIETDMCEPNFVGLSSPTQTGGVWVCLCKQNVLPGINPLPRAAVGRVGFDTVSSPSGRRIEVALLQQCSKSMMRRMRPICKNHQDRFNTLAAHLLEVCCKRSRALFPQDKFQCKTVVPGDVSEL